MTILADGQKVSIHAPREGSDLFATVGAPIIKLFQSTLPVRGATARTVLQLANSGVSIHAPREGSDNAGRAEIMQLYRFNPRSP